MALESKKFASGMCFYKMFWIFLVGCVFGAYYEEILNLVIHYHYHHELVWQLRRGVIYGPISPIYGMGGGFEYLISFLQETFLGTVSWDYTNEFLNINGRTTIPYAFVWGLLALLLVKVVYPLISNIVESFPIKFGTILTKTLLVILIADFTVSWGALIRQTLRHNGIQPISFVGRFFDTYYPDEKLKESYTNMVIIEVQK